MQRKITRESIFSSKLLLKFLLKIIILKQKFIHFINSPDEIRYLRGIRQKELRYYILHNYPID